MDQPKIERTLRLMKMLTGNTASTVKELSSKIGISARSIYRYIDTFRDAGFVIKNSDKIYRIDKSSPYFKDISELIHFTEEEAFILKNAIESIDGTNLLKQNLRKKLYSIYDYKILADTVVHKKDSKNVQDLIDAIENKKQAVLCNYSSSNSKTIRDRTIEPFGFTTNYVQIWGYDLEKKKNKLFNLSRIENVKILPSSWENEKEHQKGKIDIFRFSSFESIPVKLLMGMRATSLLKEEYPLSEKYLRKDEDDKWLLETEVCSFEGIGRFILGLSDDIEVIAPDELRKYLKKRVKKMKF